MTYRDQLLDPWTEGLHSLWVFWDCDEFVRRHHWTDIVKFGILTTDTRHRVFRTFPSTRDLSLCWSSLLTVRDRGSESRCQTEERRLQEIQTEEGRSQVVDESRRPTPPLSLKSRE